MALVGQAVSEKKIFEIVDGRTDDGRTPDHGHPISSPCEPNGSGELIKHSGLLNKHFCKISNETAEIANFHFSPFTPVPQKKTRNVLKYETMTNLFLGKEYPVLI